MVKTDQPYRVVEALKRRNESNKVYDLTMVFVGEFIRHPFAPHDDLIDATARLFDPILLRDAHQKQHRPARRIMRASFEIAYGSSGSY